MYLHTPNKFKRALQYDRNITVTRLPYTLSPLKEKRSTSLLVLVCPTPNPSTHPPTPSASPHTLDSSSLIRLRLMHRFRYNVNIVSSPPSFLYVRPFICLFHSRAQSRNENRITKNSYLDQILLMRMCHEPDPRSLESQSHNGHDTVNECIYNMS